MSFTVAREPVASLPRLMPMLTEHWEHVALFRDRIPLDPDWEKYRKLEELGIFHALIARNAVGPVGYVWLLVSPNLHYRSTLTAQADIFWLSPEARQGMAAGPAYRRLFRAAEAYLKTLGVARFSINYKFAHDLGLLFTAMGYLHSDVVVTKLL